MKVQVVDILGSYPNGYMVRFLLEGSSYYVHLGESDSLEALVRSKARAVLKESPKLLDKLRQEWVGKEIEV